jgi:hypothetical protein
MDFFNFSPQKPEEKSNDDKIVQGEIAINPDVVSENQETDQPQQDQQEQQPQEQEQQPQEEQQPEVQTMTSANCKEDKRIKYTKPGKPILSITFSLSDEHPFEVNVGSSMSYKRSDKLAYPIVYEIKDETGEISNIKRGALKNKACVGKNLPNDLAEYLPKLNSLLLDQYNMYYDTKKYNEFVDAQTSFKAQQVKDNTSTENLDVNEKAEENKEATPEEKEKRERKDKIEKLIGKLKAITTEKIEMTDVNTKLRNITDKNGVNFDELKNFLENNEEVFPLYLLPLKYGDQQIFMTNNGIVTNGNVIFSYNDISTKSKTVSGTTMEIGMWKLLNEYNIAVGFLSGEEYDDGYIRNNILDAGDFIKGGKRKTRSRKSEKHRRTKRRHHK